jgi:hypothetical protein
MPDGMPLPPLGGREQRNWRDARIGTDDLAPGALQAHKTGACRRHSLMPIALLLNSYGPRRNRYTWLGIPTDDLLTLPPHAGNHGKGHIPGAGTIDNDLKGGTSLFPPFGSVHVIKEISHAQVRVCHCSCL